MQLEFVPCLLRTACSIFFGLLPSAFPGLQANAYKSGEVVATLKQTFMPDGESTMTFQSEADVLAYLGQQVRGAGVFKTEPKTLNGGHEVHFSLSSTGRRKAKISSDFPRKQVQESTCPTQVKRPRSTNFVCTSCPVDLSNAQCIPLYMPLIQF